jgi:hypothetical protein
MTPKPQSRLYMLVLIAAMCLNISVKAQVAVEKADITKLPKGIKYKGKVKNAVRWTDSLGDNVVIATETGFNLKKQPGSKEAATEIFAYHFLVKNDTAVRLWRVYDYIMECSVDMDLSFLKNTFQVTDLNNDNVGEVWLMYKKECRGAADPYELRIIMYQGKEKFAIRGLNKIPALPASGKYKYDQAFAKGPKQFLQFAKKLWEKNM